MGTQRPDPSGVRILVVGPRSAAFCSRGLELEDEGFSFDIVGDFLDASIYAARDAQAVCALIVDCIPETIEIALRLVAHLRRATGRPLPILFVGEEGLVPPMDHAFVVSNPEESAERTLKLIRSLARSRTTAAKAG